MYNNDDEKFTNGGFEREGAYILKSDNQAKDEFEYDGIKGFIILDIESQGPQGSGTIKFLTGETVNFYREQNIIRFEGPLSTDIKAFLYDKITKILESIAAKAGEE